MAQFQLSSMGQDAFEFAKRVRLAIDSSRFFVVQESKTSSKFQATCIRAPLKLRCTLDAKNELMEIWLIPTIGDR